MRNFAFMGACNPDLIMSQLRLHPDLWNENTLRTKHPGTAHSEVSDIWVWFNEMPPSADENQLDMKFREFKNVVNDKEVISYRAWQLLPAVRGVIFPLMQQVQAHRLGRVIITRLPPGKTITPHKDGGAPATYFQRYQVALQCLPGNVFRIEDERVEFRTGEIWYIDNEKEHEVINNSADDRIVMIVDLRSD